MINAHHVYNQELRRDIFSSTRFQLDHLSQVIQTGFSGTSLSLQSLHAELRDLPARLVDAISATDATLDDDITSIKCFQRKTRKLQRRYAKVTCTCQPQTSAFGYRSGPFAFTYTRASIHEPRCPRASIQNTVTDLQLQATLCSLILGKRFWLSFQLSYGTGLSVKQNLECRRVVRDSSPAFAFIQSFAYSIVNMPIDEFLGEVDELLKMFQLGQASPHDRLLDGSTLLHARVAFPSVRNES